MKKNNRGFTLAELLIVVAIIAVLVAIAIPIFSSQLEKAREATDEANLRSLYAQLSADVLTETAVTDNTNVPVAKSYKVEKATNSSLWTGTATYAMTQQTDGREGGADIIVGGVTIASADFKTGTATITIKSDGSAATISIG